MAHLTYLAIGVKFVWDARHMIHGQPAISMTVAIAIVYAIAWIVSDRWPLLIEPPIDR